ncbi:hypothetical protein [Microbulbifer variabilis]|uniref:hypothetical protein n=1 Tax=Microbulbifer variabilis TaxID=266805 RepID=UPI001CFE5796|nr:hypothetical protein [Microbulbifer variabilis]
MLDTYTLKIRRRFELLLKAGNLTLLLSAPLLLLTVVICYPFSHYFSIPAQVAGHIFMIISATFIKIGYVSRCVAQYNLCQEVR